MYFPHSKIDIYPILDINCLVEKRHESKIDVECQKGFGLVKENAFFKAPDIGGQSQETTVTTCPIWSICQKLCMLHEIILTQIHIFRVISSDKAQSSF